MSQFGSSHLPPVAVDRKIISVGLNPVKSSKSTSPRRVGPLRGAEDVDKQTAYKNLLDSDRDADRDALLAQYQSRKPFVRKEADAEKITGLVIGKQLSQEDLIQAKLESQRIYRSKLSEDLMSKGQSSPGDVPKARNPLRKKMDVMPDIGAGFSIGNDEDMLERKRAEARRFFELSQQDLAAKINARVDPSEPGYQALKNHRRSSVAGHKESAAYENDQFSIGTDPEVAKQQKLASQREYLARLNADTGKVVKGSRVSRVSFEPAPQALRNPKPVEYVNTHGFTGLNVGGVASDNTQSQQSLAVKQKKQAAYRRALDEQLEVSRQQGDVDSRYSVDPSAPVPYMQY